MKYIAFVYWVFCCLVAGAAEGHWKTKCPNDPPTKMAEVVAFVLVAPALISYGFTAPSPPYPCKVQP